MKLSNQHEGWQDKQMWTLTHLCIVCHASCIPAPCHARSQHISLIYVLSIFR